MPDTTAERLARHRQIICRRWPHVWAALESAVPPAGVVLTEDTPEPTLCVDGVHLTSAYNRRAEAELQASAVPRESESAWVYGLALGDLVRVLLEREVLRRLTVVVMSPAVAYQSLRSVDHADWLADPRVDLVLAASQTTVHRPFAVAPACLRLAGEDAARLRDLVALELNAMRLSRYFAALQRQYQAAIEANLARYASDGDAGALFGAHQGGVAAVAAGGPTLSDQYRWLAAHRHRLALIAVTTALLPLHRAGFIPDAAVVVDHMPEILAHFQGLDTTALVRTPLVYFPTVHPDVLRWWPGPRLMAYPWPQQPHLAGLAQQLPRASLFCSGTVTHAAVDLAVRLGARQVVLLGADFSFPRGRTHADGAAEARPAGETAAHRLWVLDGHGRRVPSAFNLRAYLRDLEAYIARHPHVTFVNTGRDGARIEGALWLDELDDLAWSSDGRAPMEQPHV